MVDHLVLPAVLQVIVDHVDPSILQLLLCCIAPVCQAWQAAVANLPSQCIDVALTASKDAASQAWWCTISSFCSWLHHHGGLVRSIDISKSLALDFSAFSCWPLQEALATALIAAAEADSRKSSTAAAAAAPSAQPQDTKGNPTAAGGADNAAVPTSQPFLQLRSYSSDCMGSRCILDALPAAYLTSLQLSLPQHSRSDESLPGCNDLAAAFERLHNLQSLSLSFKLRQALSERCCSSIGSLTKLTQLNLAVELAAPTVAVLQAAMQLLPLQLLQLRCTYESWVGWNLGPLTLLTELQLHVRDVSTPRPRALELPEQLKILTLNGARANLFGAELAGTGPELTWAREWGAEVPCNLTSLQHLQAFSLKTWQPLPNALVQYLTQLTSLQDVSLAYESVRAAISSRQDMGKLKQLQRLRISWANMDSAGAAVVQRGELLQLMACWGALTTLTSLKVGLRGWVSPRVPRAPGGTVGTWRLQYCNARPSARATWRALHSAKSLQKFEGFGT